MQDPHCKHMFLHVVTALIDAVVTALRSMAEGGEDAAIERIREMQEILGEGGVEASSLLAALPGSGVTCIQLVLFV